MKRLLFTFAALLMASIAFGECALYIDAGDFAVTKADIQDGNEIAIPVRAHFSGRLNAWQLNVTYPEGMTVINAEPGADGNVIYYNARGRLSAASMEFTTAEPYTSMIGYFSNIGYWTNPANSSEWEPYGTVKWETGDYEQIVILYALFDEDFKGGEVVTSTYVAANEDDRGGTINENGDNDQWFTRTSYIPLKDEIGERKSGDANGDDEVNIADVNAIIYAILEGGYIDQYYDVNGDGEVNIADVNTVVDIILHENDNSPHKVGQCTQDHLFTRNTYGSQTVDNTVSFVGGNTQLVWLWLDDDEIYMSESVQALTPMAYNSSGNNYNEITYSSCQFDIYLPQGVSLVEGENEYEDLSYYLQGDRLPNSSNLVLDKKDITKVIDGIEYDVYTVIIYSTSSYGTHFSARNASSYQNQGALKKDDAPLLGLYLRWDDESANNGQLGDMIIANQEFGVSETFYADWSPNEYRFFYGTGGNYVTDRNMSYNRVELVVDSEPVGTTDYYIVGQGVEFGNWNTNIGAQMTQNSDGTYSYTTTSTIDGFTWFVFASGLTEYDGDWDTFNSQYRYGPTGGVDQTVETGYWYSTQKQGNGNGAYAFSGNGGNYKFTFNPYINKFRIDDVGDTPPTTDTYTVAGSPASVFGNEWDPNYTDNDMTKQQDGSYALYKENCELWAGEQVMFKVVRNHDWAYAWPADNDVFSIEESGVYDITFTFNPETEEVGYSITSSGTVTKTDPPEITTELSDNSVTVTATGEGEVKLYIDGVAVNNPYVINRDTEDKTYIATATAQAEGMAMSETTTLTITVPAMETGGHKNGDANDDDEVNIADVNAIINAILGGGYIDQYYDVNGDGEVNIADINTVVDIILHENDNRPHKVGQCTQDHLYARNTYGSQTVDNIVSFEGGNTQLVWLWLDDDEIYMSESVQALTPMAYNSSGNRYNEITYSSCQFDIYLPQGVSLVEGENEYEDLSYYLHGDRLPFSSNFVLNKKDITKVIDGIDYDVYTVIIYSTSSYGTHFSAKDASSYQNQGALKKEDAPLLGLYLRWDDESANNGQLGDMIIANQEFGVSETFYADWSPNEYRFFYGTGGNNVTERNMSYNRVKLTKDGLNNTTNEIVFIAGIDNGTSEGIADAYYIEKEGVRIDVSRGLANNSHYRIYKNETMTISSARGNISQVKIECTASGTMQYGPGCFTAIPGNYTYSGNIGTWSGDAESIEFTASSYQVRATKITVTLSEAALETTPAPEITTAMTDNSVVVTATGEGEVKLYIDGVAVNNPYVINRDTEDKTYTATATAHADGMAMSETTTLAITVPAMEAEGCYLYISDFQIPQSKLGGEIAVPVKAHFDARLNNWLVEMTYPEGMTPVFWEKGGGMTVSYIDGRGTQSTLVVPLTVGQLLSNAIGSIGTAGFWMPEGSTEYESYGAVKWEPGDYEDFLVIYFDVAPDFKGGQLVLETMPSSSRDTRGGTVPPGQDHFYTTNITVGGTELEGQIVIGDCDANGMVPVTYNGDEAVTLKVMVDGQAVPVNENGSVQLTHYGTSIVTAEATAIGYVPMRTSADVSWTAITNADWEILKAFYNQYKNERLVWDISDRNKPGSCPGVGVENGRVVIIELPGHALEGSFPTMLLALNKLTVLDLSYNNLSGDASSDMTQYAATQGIKATDLQELYLNNNGFTGNVGALAALFANLNTLDVSANHFSLVYPMVNPAVTLNLSNQVLDVNGDITGGIESLALAIPTICMYDHSAQAFSTNFEVQLTDEVQTPYWSLYFWAEDGGVYDMYVSGPYRGANNHILDGYTNLYCNNWSNEQWLRMLFTFAMGDANLNGPVDITDLQAMVKYIFGEYNSRAFNYTAANLNYDNTINVQDVVGEANLLLSMELTMPKPGMRAPSQESKPTEAYLYWENGVLYLDTSVPVTALDIVNETSGNVTWNLDAQGFVVKNSTNEQGQHTVIYSLDDAVLMPGVTAIATTTGHAASVVAAKLSNADAELVEVRLNDRMTGLQSLTEDGKSQCHIEGNELIIDNGGSLTDVNITIYTVDGKLVECKRLGHLDSGRTAINLSDVADSHNYYFIVVSNGREIIATQKLTQIR